MSRVSAARATLVIAVAWLLASCSDNLPGDVVGTYRVTMRAEDNSCGERGLPIPDGYAYSAELREDEPRGYWRTPGAPPIEGKYERAAFEFSFAMTLDLGNVDAGTNGCLVRRLEQLSGRVVVDEPSDGGLTDAADRPADAGAALTGEHRIGFTPDPSGRCANVRGPIGVFEQLPCSTRYRITGEPTKRF